MADLIERGEAVRDGKVDPTEDSMLKITSNGRAFALDVCLMDQPGPEEHERTKIDIVARNVYRVWDEHKDREYLDEWGEISPTPGALQIVFADLGTPAVDGRCDVYTELRRQLVDRGIPASQVRFVHEAANECAGRLVRRVVGKGEYRASDLLGADLLQFGAPRVRLGDHPATTPRNRYSTHPYQMLCQ